MNKNKFNIIEVLSNLLFMFIPLLMMAVINAFFAGINFGVWTRAFGTFGIVSEYIILYLISILLLGICKKGKRAITVLGIILITISIINQIKYSFMGNPVFLSDVIYIGNAGEIFSIIESDFLSTINSFLWFLLIEIVLVIGLIFLGNKLKTQMNITSKKVALLCIVIPITIFVFLFLPIESKDKFIVNNIYKRDDYNSFVTLSSYYMRFGLLGGMYGQFIEDRIYKPDGYDEELINKELNEVEEESKKWGTPNIIVLFSESFWDIDQLDEIEFNKEVTPNFNKLKEKGLFFNMISPVFGGVSANVEYEFLTGGNITYFNLGYVPYMQLYTKDKYRDNPSIITELRNNGYATKILTTGSPRLFNCGRFYDYVAFDSREFVVKVSDEYMKGQFVSDRYITDRIINEFNKKEKGSKLYYEALTMQGHMPYTKDKYDEYEIEITKSNLKENLNEAIVSYAEGIYDADKELGRLYEYINTLDEPTILVFFGDHLPYIYSGQDNVMDYLEYFNTGDELLDIYRKYNTQSLILANFKLGKDDTKYLGVDLLSSYILNHMDIELSNYYKWLYQSRKTIGAYNSWVAIDSNGTLYNTNKLDGEYKRLFDIRRNIEYELFIK